MDSLTKKLTQDEILHAILRWAKQREHYAIGSHGWEKITEIIKGLERMRQ